MVASTFWGEPPRTAYASLLLPVIEALGTKWPPDNICYEAELAS